MYVHARIHHTHSDALICVSMCVRTGEYQYAYMMYTSVLVHTYVFVYISSYLVADDVTINGRLFY